MACCQDGEIESCCGSSHDAVEETSPAALTEASDYESGAAITDSCECTAERTFVVASLFPAILSSTSPIQSTCRATHATPFFDWVEFNRRGPPALL